MPRNGSGVFSLPPGSTFTPGTLAQSAVVNGINNDIATDLNTPRPVVAGGTGSSNAAGAQTALLVDNKETYVAQSGNYTALPTDNNAVHNFTAAATVALTGAASLGANWHYTIVASGGIVTIDPNASETINGQLTLTLPAGTSTKIICDGTSFFTEFKPAVFGLRNKIINGNFRLNQRGFGGGALGAGVYGFDRWKADAGGCTFTVAGTISGGVATITAGTLVQIIPSENIETTGIHSLSWVGTATATVNGTAITSGGPISLTAAANATVKFTGGTVSRVQLEFGPATSFEERPIGLELLLCQRFFEKSYDMASAPGSNQGATVIGAFASVALNTADFYTWGDVRFKVSKFSAPTLNYWSMNGTQGVFYNATSLSNQGNIATSNASQSGFRFGCGNNAMTANNVFAAHWSAESEL